MNKAQLIDALAERLGDKKVATAAVAGLVDVVVRAVNAGDRVTITGFGVFEKRARAARTARNPRTGEAVIIQQTDVPAFRPGTLFREVISGTRALPPAGTAITAASANPAQPETSPPTSVPTTTAASRAATRVTAATHLTAVQLPTTKAPNAKAKGKAAKGEPKASLKIAAKAKGSAKSPAKGREKKAGKKSLAKKSATKK
ncbi:MAG TPA: HU family DNA-binding protein [Pseudonocardiaceae bacterium]|nr:HU family DNA-binding protein [Pseudonocardiaceae bacterium]